MSRPDEKQPAAVEKSQMWQLLINFVLPIVKVEQKMINYIEK